MSSVASPSLVTDCCRSLDDSIDLVAPGASTYSPVKIPSAPLQQLGGEAKVSPRNMIHLQGLLCGETLARSRGRGKSSGAREPPVESFPI